MIIDVIIPAYTINEYKQKVLEDTLNSLRRCESKYVKFNIIVFEQNHLAKPSKYADQTVFYNFKYNYNGVLNAGFELSKSEYVIFSNDDVIYYPGFFEELLKAFDAGYLSVSPNGGDRVFQSRYIEPFTEGYDIGIFLMGWCIAIKREVMKKIGGKLDDVCPHWYADWIYALQLKQAGIKHALVRNAHAKHLSNTTLPYIKDRQKVNSFKTGAYEIYRKAAKEKYGVEV